MRRYKNIDSLCFHQVLFIVQIGALLISSMRVYIAPALGQAAYFTAVLSAPILVLLLGYHYFQEDRFRIARFLAFCAEVFFFIAYLGSLIYGIWEHSDVYGLQILFQKLLIIFIIDTLISGLAFFEYYFNRRSNYLRQASSLTGFSD